MIINKINENEYGISIYKEEGDSYDFYEIKKEIIKALRGIKEL